MYLTKFIIKTYLINYVIITAIELQITPRSLYEPMEYLIKRTCATLSLRRSFGELLPDRDRSHG